MPLINDKRRAANQLREGIGAAAACEECSIVEMEYELARWLWGRVESGRTIQSWKYPSSIPEKIDDGSFFAVVWRILASGVLDLNWLEELLEATGVPIYKPISRRLLEAYFRQARVQGRPLAEENIATVIETLFSQISGSATEYRVDHESADSDFSGPTLRKLLPLEPISTRKHIEEARSISALGLSLFRFLPAFQDSFREALERGTTLRVLLVDPGSSALDMIGLRSTSAVPLNFQRRHIESSLELLALWFRQINRPDLDVRLINYMPPYGITIYRHLTERNKDVCLVRLYTFRTPTSDAPLIHPDSVRHPQWFEFFSDQFEKMWEVGQVCEFERNESYF